MCIYCGTNKYRKIYENHHGPIPVDPLAGRKCDIHHIDGNHSNNHPDNLIALTRYEHYLRHYEQGDWAACLRMSGGLLLLPEEIHKLVNDMWTTERREKQRQRMLRQWRGSKLREAAQCHTRKQNLSKSINAMWENNPQLRNEFQKRAIARFSNPLLKEKWLMSVQSDEYRKAQSQRMKEILQDPNIRTKISDNSKKMWQCPIYRENHRQRLIERYKDPAAKAAFVQAGQRLNQDPDVKKRRADLQTERMCKNPELKQAGAKRFKEMNKWRNAIEHTCPNCARVFKGPGYTNHARKCVGKM